MDRKNDGGFVGLGEAMVETYRWMVVFYWFARKFWYLLILGYVIAEWGQKKVWPDRSPGNRHAISFAVLLVTWGLGALAITMSNQNFVPDNPPAVVEHINPVE